MNQLAFFLEERSARALLEGLLPQILPAEIQVKYVVFEGKQDLEKNLVRKLRAWQTPDTVFVVLRDQDSGNCIQIKQQLKQKCVQANRPDTLVRIACRELESWYLGSLTAVEEAFDISNLAHQQNNRKFRNPDLLGSPAQELKLLTQHKYQKVLGSRKLGHILLNHENCSLSFQHFVSGLKKLIPSP